MIARESKRPRDYEVMDMVLQRGDAVELARLLSVSPQLVRAWCRPPETEDEFATGKFGPLARLRTLISMIREDDSTTERAYPIAEYISRLCAGTFVPDLTLSGPVETDVIKHISAILKETGQAVEAMRDHWLDGHSSHGTTELQRMLCAKEVDDAIVALIHLKQWLSMQRASTR